MLVVFTKKQLDQSAIHSSRASTESVFFAPQPPNPHSLPLLFFYPFEAFVALDSERKGVLDAKSFRQLFRDIGESPDAHSIAELVERISSSDDGTVSRADLEAFLRRNGDGLLY